MGGKEGIVENQAVFDDKKSSKLQHSSIREIPITNSLANAGCPLATWCLELLWMLELGIWSFDEVSA
jgi:hypothetical protein